MVTSVRSLVDTVQDQQLRYQSIPHLLKDRATRNPDAIVISAPGRECFTFGRLYAHVNNVVKTLNALGVGRNDRVAIVLPNGPEMAVAFLAVAAGATSAPLNPAYRASDFDFYPSDLKAKALIVLAGKDSPAIEVAQVSSSTMMPPQSVSFNSGVVRPMRGLGSFPMATTAVSTWSVKKSSGMGMGRARPEASGSPSFIR